MVTHSINLHNVTCCILLLKYYVSFIHRPTMMCRALKYLQHGALRPLYHGAGGQQCCNQSVYCQSAYSAGSTMQYLLQWRHLQQYPDTDVQFH